MIEISCLQKIYVACQPVDFRAGIDGYAALCKKQLQLNPYSGHCFIFRNKKRTAIKVLLYDGTGFWLCHKRRSKGRFVHWPSKATQVVSINTSQLSFLIKQ